MPVSNPYAAFLSASGALPRNGMLPTVDPNYAYTSGNKNLLGDVAQLRSRLAGGANPFDEKGKYGAAHEVGHTPLLGRVGNAFGYDQRKALAIFAALMAGGAAGAGAFGGAGAVGAGAGAGAGAGGTAATTAAGAGGYFTPAGTWVAGASPGSFGAAGGFGPAVFGGGAGTAGLTTGLGGPGGAGPAAPPWYNTFGGQTAINTGANLFGGLLQNRATKKAQNQSRADIQKRIQQALAALAPEHIMALAQQFLPQMAANASGAGQTAIQAVREQAARTGQLESPRALNFEAGTRAKLASDVQQRAFEAGANTAGGEASAITGAPYTPIQPQTGFADAITNSINQAYYAKARSQAPPPYYPQSPYGSPYRWFGGPQGGY